MPSTGPEGWIDFSPVRKSIRSLQPRGVEGIDGAHIDGPFGETVPLEMVKGWGIMPDILDRLDTPVDYFRVANLLFLNDRLKYQIPAELQREYSDQIIWVSKGQSLFWDESHKFYSPLSIYALTTLDLKDTHVLDLGAGDGVMSLTALKLGASLVTSVELYPRYETVYRRHLAANGFGPEKTKFIAHDLADAQGIVAQLSEPSPQIAVSNIGFYYRGANMRAIELGASVPGVQTYIDGAYYKGHPTHDPGRAIKHLEGLGFGSNLRKFTLHEKALAYAVDRSAI